MRQRGEVGRVGRASISPLKKPISPMGVLGFSKSMRGGVPPVPRRELGTKSETAGGYRRGAMGNRRDRGRHGDTGRRCGGRCAGRWGIGETGRA